MASQVVVRLEIQPQLLKVPLEVLLQITSNLITIDYCNLRCTCKHIESTLLNAFSREYFTKRHFMLTEFSLRALVDISKSRFSSSLTHIILGLERPTMTSLFNSHFYVHPTDPLDGAAKSNRILEHYLSHMNLLNTGQDVELLAEAFSNMANLSTVGIRDFNSRSRRRDYPNVEWRSYGVNTYVVETGQRLSSPQRSFNPNVFVPDVHEGANYLSRLFLNILCALEKAGSDPKHFEVILRTIAIHDYAFNVPKYALVDKVLTNLKTLFLDLTSNFPATQIEVNNTPIGCPSYFLRQFLSKLHQIEHLRLNFSTYKSGESNDLLSWLSQPVSAPNSPIGTLLPVSPAPISFANLKELDIGMLTVEPKILVSILQKHQTTLRVVSFHKLALLQIDYAKGRDKVNLWARFFEQLAKLKLGLSAMNMSMLTQQGTGGQHDRPVAFRESKNPREKKWAATDIQSGLRDFIATVYIIGDDDETDSSHSDESGGEDDEDGEDEDAEDNGDNEDEA